MMHRCLADVADKLEKKVSKHGYEMVFAGDPKFPPRLTGLADAPPVLFTLGPGADVTPRRRVGMVGTRNPDTGFLEKARLFVERTAAVGLGVISGGAVGVDQACHGAAMRVGAETWAFVGCAIDQLDEAQRVLVRPFRDYGGTLFSEFPPGTRSSRATFPRRNRLIAGASDALLVLRAPLGSGALHTVKYALANDRPVLAMPGDFFNSASSACNTLIREGYARICLEPEHVHEALGVSSKPVEVTLNTTARAEPISELCAQVLAHVIRGAEIDFDVLVGLTRFDSGAVASALLELELANRVVQRPGRRYEMV